MYSQVCNVSFGLQLQCEYVILCNLRHSFHTNTFHVLLVILTNSAVTNDLNPLGVRGVLGYGLGSPGDAPPNISLVGAFLPCVTFQVHLVS